MKLYDNDAYRDEFMEGVYSLLNDDPTWNRANAIIDLFDSAPAVEAIPVSENAPSPWTSCGRSTGSEPAP